MKSRVVLSATAILFGISAGAFAQGQQQEHQQHHPGGAIAEAQPAPTPAPATPPAATQAPPVAAAPGPGQMPMGQMMQGMPEQCRAMMQNMPQGCMQMMQQMMQGRPGAAMPGTAAQPSSQSTATKAYMEAVVKMHGPMLQGIQASDPDVAFARAMIAHHQGAIDMAKAVLQYGNSEQTKKWASDIIRDQQREVNEMQDWIQKNSR